MNQRLLSDQVVRELAAQCSPEDGDVIEAGGILRRLSFSRRKIEANHERIKALLDELPLEFQQSAGGGWSFLNACNDRHGNQWTDLHTTMEMLFCLGAAAGYVTCMMPRDMWSLMPGGVPYVTVRSVRGEPGAVE